MTIKPLTKRLIKTIASLDQSKYRRREGLFKAEGKKCVEDTCRYFQRSCLAATETWINEHYEIASLFQEVYAAPASSMAEMSNLASRPEVIAVYQIPESSVDLTNLRGSLTIALDTIQDPGNLGTIVRIADWFGVKEILCSRETVDVYNPKAVMSTMGAIARVNVHYVDLAATLRELSETIPVYGTFLNGENLFNARLSEKAVVVFGNEGNGICESVASAVNHRLTIPSYPPGQITSESLNVAMAAAITIAQFRNNG